MLEGLTADGGQDSGLGLGSTVSVLRAVEPSDLLEVLCHVLTSNLPGLLLFVPSCIFVV